MQVHVNVGIQNMACEFNPLHFAAFTDPFIFHSHEKLQPELVAMVTQQLDKWPSHLKFNVSKTKKRFLREVLLDASYRFIVTALANEPSSHTGAEPAVEHMPLAVGVPQVQMMMRQPFRCRSSRTRTAVPQALAAMLKIQLHYVYFLWHLLCSAIAFCEWAIALVNCIPFLMAVFSD